MNTRTIALLVLALGCSSCSETVSATRAPTAEITEESYAVALRDAFEVYADEVYTAALFDYTSVAEAEAVVRTLSGNRFDHQLAAALERRGLSVAGLARFADEHPAFFHEQQKLHWGKLQELEATLASIPLKVRPSAATAALVLDDTSAGL
jgi:hypothetical protein